MNVTRSIQPVEECLLVFLFKPTLPPWLLKSQSPLFPQNRPCPNKRPFAMRSMSRTRCRWLGTPKSLPARSWLWEFGEAAGERCLSDLG